MIAHLDANAVATRAAQLAQEHHRRVHVLTDRLFAPLLVFQWIACIAIAAWNSPWTYEGPTRSVHVHLVAAIVLGGIFALVPCWLVWRRGGSVVTRHTIAICQSATGALLIHLSGGRIETHFHIFGSLAFLSFYRDWRVLVTASLVVAFDHFVRGMFWPESVYGIATPGAWRWAEHTGWVLFEDLFLILACRRGVQEIAAIAQRTAELEETNASIERLVVERTEELAAARDEAVRAAHVKSEFLANMSHEIRTPLNGIVGMTGLLQETELDGTQQDYARTVQVCSEALLALVDDVLDFSKLEAGRLDLEVVPFDLASVLADATDILSPRAEQKDIELILDIEPSLPRAFVGDPTRLRQVVLNLLGNAVKFTERGEVVLVATARPSDGDRLTVRVEVRDTGIGIPADRRDRLFRAFSQVDASTTRKYGGTGLGLVISQRIVTAMGGTIGVDARDGGGSVFWIEVVLPTAATANDAHTGLELDELRGVRALIVDDNATNRHVMRTILAAAGMDCDVADRPSSALAKLEAASAAGTPFGIVVLDFQMPEQDGIEFGRTLKADPTLRDIPLLLATSVGRLGHATTAIEAGFAGFQTKPLKPRTLIRAVADALRGAPHASHAEPTDAVGPVPPTDTGTAPIRVLVVEDNPINQKVAVHTLRRLGCIADVAVNGRDALSTLERARYDLVLMDCQMPELDGFQATTLLRAQPGPERSVPVVAMTAHALSGDRERCLAAGMDDYLTKPFRLADLEAVLTRWASGGPRVLREPSED